MDELAFLRTLHQHGGRSCCHCGEPIECTEGTSWYHKETISVYCGRMNDDFNPWSDGRVAEP